MISFVIICDASCQCHDKVAKLLASVLLEFKLLMPGERRTDITKYQKKPTENRPILLGFAAAYIDLIKKLCNYYT